MPAPGEMNVLVVGGGGREHALCWRLCQSEKVRKIFCAPGNGGTATTNKTQNVAIKVDEFQKLADFAQSNKVDLIVIGPDNPLAGGIVDFLQDEGLTVFGPVKNAARLEWSKTFAKEFMSTHGLPTAKWFAANDYTAAVKLAKENETLIVKYDGLALGKGVFVCDDVQEVEKALQTIFVEKAFGQQTDIILEERLYGEELSLLFFCDGKQLVAMPACQDHKRRFACDKGPNTGGMGAYCPVELYKQSQRSIQKFVVEPLEKALRASKIDFRGVLFVGLLIDKQTSHPYILEFNARFGDPETQALMPLLDSDLAEILWSCAKGDLAPESVKWKKQYSCSVVAAAATYPQSSSNGETIEIGEIPEDSEIFQAGTALVDGRLVTAGGRVLAATATGASLNVARKTAYDAIAKVHFAGMDFRVDIAQRETEKCLPS